MKNLLQKSILIVTLALFGMSNIINAQTTVANGNWSNPATWGGLLPTGSGTVVINHAITLDMDYSHTSGSITINAAGALNGNSSMRLFALNYPSGTASLTVNGSFNVARVPCYLGVVTNSGTFQADSLLSSATITNNSLATINTSQFTNYLGGIINNNGTITSINFLNIETVSNAGTLNSNDFTNSKSFTNSANGHMNISHDFLNFGTLANLAIFTNNGSVNVGNDWENDVNPATIQGIGKFCIQNNTWNRGTMSGTFDFCDQTGGNIDLNTGIVAATITYCLYPCSVGINELSENSDISIFPNPFSSSTTLRIDNFFKNVTLTVYNSLGHTVKQINLITIGAGQTITLHRDNLPSGLYFIRLTEDNKVITTDKLVITD